MSPRFHAQLWLLPLLLTTVPACMEREPTTVAPAPAVSSERNTATEDAEQNDGDVGFFDDGTSGTTPTDPQGDFGVTDPGTGAALDPLATGLPPATTVTPVGATATADPIAAAIPQLMQCFQSESCDPEQLVGSMPAATQQALMGALQQYEETGAGPLAPYAAQAQQAGIDITDLFY